MKVAVIGMGIVGSAQVRMFKEHVHITYDPKVDSSYPQQQIAECDFAVLAVGTPEGLNGASNLSGVWEALTRLPSSLPVLIRSSIPPGTMKIIESGVSVVAHCPEFLHERKDGAWKESYQVPFMILGGDEYARNFFKPFLWEVYPGIIHECTALEAELVKYTANLYLATKITFVNEMATVCENYGADWEAVRDGWVNDPRVDSSYTSMWGFPPGFGGRCWPKDLAALIHASTTEGYDPFFLRAVQAANKRFKRHARSGSKD